MIEKKNLNLEKPILKTWSSESHFMSMILGMEGSKDWIANNYIQMIGQNMYGIQKTVFCFFPKHDPFCEDTNINVWNSCPFLDTKYVSRATSISCPMQPSENRSSFPVTFISE